MEDFVFTVSCLIKALLQHFQPCLPSTHWRDTNSCKRYQQTGTESTFPRWMLTGWISQPSLRRPKDNFKRKHHVDLWHRIKIVSSFLLYNKLKIGLDHKENHVRFQASFRENSVWNEGGGDRGVPCRLGHTCGLGVNHMDKDLVTSEHTQETLTPLGVGVATYLWWHWRLWESCSWEESDVWFHKKDPPYGKDLYNLRSWTLLEERQGP